MEIYYVSKEPLHNGAHEVHKRICTRLPHQREIHYLGAFPNAEHALVAAMIFYAQTVRCSLCNAPVCSKD